jgi:hypothetical protein
MAVAGRAQIARRAPQAPKVLTSCSVVATITLPDRTLLPLAFQASAECWSWFRDGLMAANVLTLPDNQFCYCRRVEDDQSPRFVWRGGRLEEGPHERAPHRGAVVLLAESPHKAEFEDHGKGKAITPMRGAGSRRLLKQALPSLLNEAAACCGIELDEVDVVVFNSVQYQASLAACIKPTRRDLSKRDRRRRKEDLAAVRDATWRAIFQIPCVQDDLRRRLEALEPILVLVAATRGVQFDAVSFVKQTGHRYASVTRHVAGWATPPRICCCGGR